jgi:hypothetical protein
VLTGHVDLQSANGHGLLVAKLDANGDPVWQKRYDVEPINEGRGIVETATGYLVVGET